MGLKVSKLSKASLQKTSKWQSTPLTQDELVELKKAGVDGAILSLQGIPDLPVVFGNLDLFKSHWVTGTGKDGTSRTFLSLADFGGRGVMQTENVVELRGKPYRVDVGLKVSLVPLA